MTLMTVDLKDKTPSANLGLYKEGCAHPVRSSARGPDPSRAFGPASRHGVQPGLRLPLVKAFLPGRTQNLA